MTPTLELSDFDRLFDLDRRGAVGGHLLRIGQDAGDGPNRLPERRAQLIVGLHLGRPQELTQFQLRMRAEFPLDSEHIRALGRHSAFSGAIS